MEPRPPGATAGPLRHGRTLKISDQPWLFIPGWQLTGASTIKSAPELGR